MAIHISRRLAKAAFAPKKRPKLNPWQAAANSFVGCLFFPAFMIGIAIASHNAAIDADGESPMPEPIVSILDTDKDGILNIHGDPPVLAAVIAGPLGFALCCGGAGFYLQRRRLRQDTGSRQ